MADIKVNRGVITIPAVAAADNVYFLGGSAFVSANLDHSGIANIAILEVNREFSGMVGSSSGSLKARVTTRLVYDANAGDLWFESNGSAAEDSALVQLTGGGHLHVTGAGTVTRLEVSNGQCTIATSAVITNLRVAGGNTLVYDDTSTDPTLVEVFAGSVLLERGATTLRHVGGQTIVKHNTTGPNVFTTVDVYGPGLKLVGCGTITTLNAMGGIPDVSELDQPLTITNTNINMTLRGAKELLNHPKITFTNAATKFFHEGRN
jgi:hypothetical protein